MITRKCECSDGEIIGLSDGSSVYGWQCSKCGHKWPRTPTERGKWRFEQKEREMSERYGGKDD